MSRRLPEGGTGRERGSVPLPLRVFRGDPLLPDKYKGRLPGGARKKASRGGRGVLAVTSIGQSCDSRSPPPVPPPSSDFRFAMNSAKAGALLVLLEGVFTLSDNSIRATTEFSRVNSDSAIAIARSASRGCCGAAATCSFASSRSHHRRRDNPGRPSSRCVPSIDRVPRNSASLSLSLSLSLCLYSEREKGKLQGCSLSGKEVQHHRRPNSTTPIDSISAALSTSSSDGEISPRGRNLRPLRAIFYLRAGPLTREGQRGKKAFLSRPRASCRSVRVTRTRTDTDTREVGGKLPTGGAILKILGRHVDIGTCTRDCPSSALHLGSGKILFRPRAGRGWERGGEEEEEEGSGEIAKRR